jgi:hypothetical protein
MSQLLATVSWNVISVDSRNTDDFTCFIFVLLWLDQYVYSEITTPIGNGQILSYSIKYK